MSVRPEPDSSPPHHGDPLPGDTPEAIAERTLEELEAARRGWIFIALAMLISVPWLAVRFLTDFHALPPTLVALLTGVAILGAAFILSWAAEAFQLDVSQALALALLSLIAVLPEYAVDVVFAWRAASDPVECRVPELAATLEQGTCQAGYAVANMTGANRLLIGIGWSSVVILAWWRSRRVAAGKMRGAPDPQVIGGAVKLERGQALEIGALSLATLYSFFIPLKGGIGLLDTVILVTLFGVYAWATSRVPAGHPELVGPAASIGQLAPTARRIVTYALFVWAAVVIFAAAEPFAEGLIESGAALGVDEFLLVQWVAPLASESPEFLVALLFVWRGTAAAGLRTLVASKVNQWTLLIGTLGLAYSIALGSVANLPIDSRQAEELFLTSAQSLFALILIANFDLSLKESLVLLATFLLQLFFPSTEVRLVMAGLYVLLGVGLLIASPARRAMLLQIPAMIREAITPVPQTRETVAAERSAPAPH